RSLLGHERFGYGIPSSLLISYLLSEGLRPSNSPTRALAPRFVGALRSRGSLAMLARFLATSVSVMGFPLVFLSLIRGAAPLELAPRHALSRAASSARSDRVARSPCSLASWPRALGLWDSL